LAERLELLSRWPIAAVPVLRFDQTIAATSYREFVERWLLRGLGARHLVLGWNVRIGSNRQGNQQRIEELSRELSFELTMVPAVLVDGEPASSTRTRHALDAGDVEAAAHLLGRPYSLAGTIVRGTGRGRVMGIPTANLEIDSEKLIPANGVYAVWAQVGAQRYLGALNIGVAPTLRDDAARIVEVHLLDYTGDLYGVHLQLEFMARIRDEQRFSGPETLVQQIHRDIEAVRRALRS